jgi:hypothetical protein
MPGFTDSSPHAPSYPEKFEDVILHVYS